MKKPLAFALSAALALAPAAEAAAQHGRGDRLSLIRDAEIEATIRAYAMPVFAAAGVPTGAIKVHLVADDRLNAFVAGGSHMFINTGLLARADHAGQVIAVIAHETGHIVGGHLVRLYRELQDAQIRAIIATILSAAAAVAARDGRAAVAGQSLGQRIIEGTFYQFTRSQEAAADQFGLTVLDRMGISARGLAEFLAILRQQESILVARQDPYVRTHPLTAERLEEVRRHMARSPHTNAPLPARFQVMHARMRAKLIGFLQPPERVFEHYRGRENTLEARYALAVANHRDARTAEALRLIEGLIKEQPNDAYFHELRGQILYESGRPREAIAAYERAAKALPGEPLVRVDLAKAQLAVNDPALDRAALANLREAVRRDDTNPEGWRQLSVAYGRVGELGESALANAEFFYLVGSLPDLRAAIARAERLLRPGTAAWQRLEDLKTQVAQIREDRRR
jgi:predicted Zn-dependent protease